MFLTGWLLLRRSTGGLGTTDDVLASVTPHVLHRVGIHAACCHRCADRSGFGDGSILTQPGESVLWATLPFAGVAGAATLSTSTAGCGHRSAGDVLHISLPCISGAVTVTFGQTAYHNDEWLILRSPANKTVLTGHSPKSLEDDAVMRRGDPPGRRCRKWWQQGPP